MIAPSVRKSSAFEVLAIPGIDELHLWLCHREIVDSSDEFLREVLSRYSSVAPAKTRITRGLHGKPALVEPVLPLAFNLSDSGDWLVMAVSDGAAVGIDLEYCDPGREVLRLARRCFASTELADLQTCTGLERVNRFYDYWTLKEAHIKATGGSLARELEATSFTLVYPGGESGDALVGSIVALAPMPATPAWYCLLQPLEGYRLAICCCAPQDFALGLSLFELPGSGVTVDRSLALRAVSMFPDSTHEADRL